MTATRRPVRRPLGRAYPIRNAACPRPGCPSALWHDPDANVVYCPTCEHRKTAAAVRGLRGAA